MRLLHQKHNTVSNRLHEKNAPTMGRKGNERELSSQQLAVQVGKRRVDKVPQLVLVTRQMLKLRIMR